MYINMNLCVQENSSIIQIDLSWNGLGMQGALALSECLKENCCLKEIDITCNRISGRGLELIASGLRSNESLTTLKVRKRFKNNESTLSLRTIKSL